MAAGAAKINCAKRSQFPPAGGADAGSSVRNKANFWHSDGKGKYLVEKEL